MADTFKGIITADGKKRQLPYRNVIETPVSDETLSIQGAFADSKAVGDKFKKVNAETDSLKEDLVNYNCSELLYSDAIYKSGTSQGIAYTWNADKTICEIKGTSTGYSATNNIFYNASGLPKNLNVGKKYYAKFGSSDLKIALQVGFFKDGATSNAETNLYTNDFILDIPSNCTGMYIRLYVQNGYTVDGTCTNIGVFDTVSNKELKEKMDILEKDTVFLANSVENPELFLIDATFTDGVSSGVIYKWNESKRECAVSGIANNLSLRNIYYSETSLPRNIKAGYKYSLKYKTTNKNIRLVIGCFLNGATSGADCTIITDDTIISIPGNCTGMYIRYEVSNGLEANGSITNVRIFKNNNSHSLSGPTTIVKTTSTDTNIAGRSFSLIPKKYNRKPILTIIDDDGRNSFYTVYKSLIQKGYPIVCCIDPVNWTGKTDRFMSWEQVHELEEIGCEFIVHGAYPFMIGDNQHYKTADELRLYFEEAQAEFKKQKLSDWDLAVYPQSDHTHETRLILSEYFRGAFASKEHDDIYYSTPPISQYRIARWFFNYDDLSSGFETAKLQIDGAIANNGWFVICTHSEMFDTDGKAIQTLESIINYAEQNGMSIVNARDGIDMFSNLLQIGDFSNTGSNYGYPCRVIGCDGTEFISPQFENNHISISDGENTIQKIANISNIGNGFCIVTIDAGISELKAVSTLLKITGLNSKPIIQSFPAVIRINANKYKNVVAVRSGNDILFKESNGDNMLISSSDMTTYTSIELSYIAQML